MRILLVVYDNGSYIHYFPQGIAYIASVLLKNGHYVEIYNQDKFHYPKEHLTDYLNKSRFDMIGVGVIAGYYQYRKLLEISDAIGKVKKRPFYVIGGHGPSPEPEFFLKKTQADAIVIGEGEYTIKELVRCLEDKGSLSDVKGIAYRKGDEVSINERRPLIKDIDAIPFPAHQLLPIDYYKLIKFPNSTNRDFTMPVLSGRGCTFNCNFCYRMDKGFRTRSNKNIIDEVNLLKKEYDINYIIFSDELFMSSEARTVSLCEDFIKADLKIKFYCQGRLNYATPEVLNTMKKAGCVFIGYGIEAMDDTVLRNTNKALTTEQIIKGVKATQQAGISPGMNIIFGNIGDNEDTLRKGVEFLLTYGNGAELRTIRPVTPYPGSPLYYYAIKKGLLKDVEEFYEKKHVNSDLISINFTEMSDKDFHRCLFEANSKLIAHYFQRQEHEIIKQAERLYIGHDTDFRGFRQT